MDQRPFLARPAHRQSDNSPPAIVWRVPRAFLHCSESWPVARQRRRIPDFLVQHNSYCWIDGIFFPFAAAAENHACRADLLALHRREISGPRTRNYHRVLRLRAASWDRRSLADLRPAVPPSAETCSSALPEEINFSLCSFLPRRVSRRRPDAASIPQVPGRVRANLPVRRRAELPRLPQLPAHCRSCCPAADPCP